VLQPPTWGRTHFSRLLRHAWATHHTRNFVGRSCGIFLFTTASRTALGPTQPPIQWVPGALSLEVKRQGLEADHSPPCSAEVKNEWGYTSTPPVRLHDVMLSSSTGTTLPFPCISFSLPSFVYYFFVAFTLTSFYVFLFFVPLLFTLFPVLSLFLFISFILVSVNVAALTA
jgi:hypothetical protein